MAVLQLRLLSRPGCHLCEEFAAALDEALTDRPYALEILDVDSRGEWRVRFGQRIPVLLNETGGVLGEGIFDADSLRRALQA